jgi:hypothetical protein
VDTNRDFDLTVSSTGNKTARGNDHVLILRMEVVVKACRQGKPNIANLLEPYRPPRATQGTRWNNKACQFASDSNSTPLIACRVPPADMWQAASRCRHAVPWSDRWYSSTVRHRGCPPARVVDWD